MSLINLFFTNLKHDIFNMMYMYGIVMTLQYKPWIPLYKYCNSTCKEKQLISVLENFICVCYDKMINILTCFIQSQIQFCPLVNYLGFIYLLIKRIINCPSASSLPRLDLTLNLIILSIICTP